MTHIENFQTYIGVRTTKAANFSSREQFVKESEI